MSIGCFEKGKTLRYWCQKVLPLVYDDSLSYYELLNKVVKYLNDTIESVSEMGDDFAELYDYVHKYMEIENHKVYVNVAAYVNELHSGNIVDAINSALNDTPYIYIPAGTYTFNMNISTDCEILLDRNCYLQPGRPVVTVVEDAQPVLSMCACIRFQNCSAKVYGGNLVAGQLSTSRQMLYDDYIRSIAPNFDGQAGYGIIEFHDCHDSEISGFKCECSRFPAVVKGKDCTNFTVRNAEMRNCLGEAIGYFQGGTNLLFENLVIENIRCAYSRYWCYGIVISTLSFTGTVFTPPKNVTIRNCYVKNSEDAGIDSHGSTNTIIENNTVLDCVAAIICYNDCRRMPRPEGWQMTGTIIRNNYCYSEKTGIFVNPDTGVETVYHPFMFVGSANTRGYYHESVEGDEGTFFDFNGAEIVNNYFKTNNHSNYVISLNACSRNVNFSNNYVEVMHDGSKPLQFLRAMNVRITNNTFNCKNAPCFTRQSWGVIEDNTGLTVGFTGGYLSYFSGGQGTEVGMPAPKLTKCGDITRDDTQRRMLITNSYGICAIDSSVIPENLADVPVVISDGIMTCEHNRFLPQMVIVASPESGGTNIRFYIEDCIDFHSCKIRGSSSETIIPDGNYTVNLDICSRNYVGCDLTSATTNGEANVKEEMSSSSTTIDTLESGTSVLVNAGVYNARLGYYQVAYIKNSAWITGYISVTSLTF